MELEGGTRDVALEMQVLPSLIQRCTLNGRLQDPSSAHDVGHLEQFHLALSMHSRNQDPFFHTCTVLELGSPLKAWAETP